MTDRPEVSFDPEVADAVRRFVEHLAAVMSGQSNTCLRCGSVFEKLEQVGRSVYARPCGCRQYQGRVPKAQE